MRETMISEVSLNRFLKTFGIMRLPIVRKKYISTMTIAIDKLSKQMGLFSKYNGKRISSPTWFPVTTAFTAAVSWIFHLRLVPLSLKKTAIDALYGAMKFPHERSCFT